MSCSIVGWCALPLEAQAAWLQAVFSVMGIGVAIAIPAFHHFRDRREKVEQEVKRSRALALLLIPTLNAWIDSLDGVTGRLHEAVDASAPRTVPWRDIAPRLVLGKQGKQLATQTHLMGSAAIPAQNFFYRIAVAHEIARNCAREESTAEQDLPRATELLRVLEEARRAAYATRDAAHRLLTSHQPAYGS